VLNDGAPVGYRQVQGKDVPVFNALELLQPSSFGTYVARVKLPPDGDCGSKLTQIADTLDGSAEDWSTSVRMICKACSEGRPHQTHDTEAARDATDHIIGIAARDHAHATKILTAWTAEMNDVHVLSLEDALDARAT
jgi:hypothetical protein